MEEQSGQSPASPVSEETPKSYPELALAGRYIAAWGEISSRIQGRDNIILTFVIVSITIIGASLASRETEIAQYLPLAIPYVAFILTQLWTANDLLIGLLSQHLGDVAKEAGPIKEWDWHVGKKYVEESLKRRAFMYGAHIIAVMILCLLALGTSSKLSEHWLEQESLKTTLSLSTTTGREFPTAAREEERN